MKLESKERVSSLLDCPMGKDENLKELWPIPETVIQNPSHGMAGRRMISKRGRKVYELAWYHSKFGWMTREEAWKIWQKLSTVERYGFPAISWWP